jgi:hypothetical protein
MKIVDNARNGVITTVLGCLITVAAVVSVFVPVLEIDWAGAAIGMGVGLGLIGFGKK